MKRITILVDSDKPSIPPGLAEFRRDRRMRPKFIPCVDGDPIEGLIAVTMEYDSQGAYVTLRFAMSAVDIITMPTGAVGAD